MAKTIYENLKVDFVKLSERIEIKETARREGQPIACDIDGCLLSATREFRKYEKKAKLIPADSSIFSCDKHADLFRAAKIAIECGFFDGVEV